MNFFKYSNLAQNPLKFFFKSLFDWPLFCQMCQSTFVACLTSHVEHTVLCICFTDKGSGPSYDINILQNFLSVRHIAQQLPLSCLSPTQVQPLITFTRTYMYIDIAWFIQRCSILDTLVSRHSYVHVDLSLFRHNTFGMLYSMLNIYSFYKVKFAYSETAYTTEPPGCSA